MKPARLAATLAAASLAAAVSLSTNAYAAPVAQAAAKRCASVAAQTPDGYTWKTRDVTVKRTNCKTSRKVLVKMIERGTVAGGGYGEYKVIGRTGGFTCRSRKAAVHYFEARCTKGSALIHGYFSFEDY